MAQFELAILGTPQFHAGGQAVKFATRKAQALLIFLAVEQVPVAREKLIDLLWTDSDVARGQMSLRTTLAQVRRALGERKRERATATQPLLLAEVGTLAFNSDADCQLDVRLLDKAYSLSRSVKVGAVSPREARSILQQAVAAYAGDFLDGFSLGDSPNFDDWMSLQREKWHARFSAVLDRLSQLQFEGGEFAAGIETANRWINHDPLNEIAHRRLMQLHLAVGNRAAALQAYEACQAILMRELNAVPSPETEALGERLRTQSIPASVPEHEPVPASKRPQVTATPLIGRVEEHLQLVQAYRLARDGQPHALVIQGEPGIGKTRLAQEFLGWAVAQGAAVIRGAAHEATLNSPYQVWVDAFRTQVNRREGQAALDALEPAWQQALAQVLPELAAANAMASRANAPNGAATMSATENDGAQHRGHLFEAAFRFVASLTQPRAHSAIISPRIVFLDDAQWADAASLDLLHHLVRRCVEESLPILVVMTLRAEATDAFEPTLTTLRRHATVEAMTLNALAQADSERLVQALLAQTFKRATSTDETARQTAHFSQTMFDETAGHPLYLLESFKSLFESAASNEASNEDELDLAAELARWQSTLEGWLAPGVKEVIRARLRRVSPQAMPLIHALAVLGQHNPLEACRHAAGLGEDEALSRLDEAIQRGLLRESANGAISFTHDKIREVVYADLTASRRRALHRRSAESLERLYPNRLDDYAPLIAQHFDASDDSRAQAYFQRAGAAAAKVYAYREAAAHYARAIELAVVEERGLEDGEHRATARAAIADLHFRLASMHIQVTHYGASVETVRQLGALAREWQDSSLEHLTQVWIAPNLALPGPDMRLDEAEQLARHILSQTQAKNSALDEVHALRTLMRVALWRAQFDLALRCGKAILEGSDVQADQVVYAYVLDDLTMIEMFRHDFDAAERYQTQAITLWQSLDRPALMVTSLSQASFIATRRGEFKSAVSLSQEALSVSQRANADWPTRLSQAHVGPAYFELGQTDHAIEVMQEAIQIRRLRQQDVTYILTSADLARAYGCLGRASEGWEVAHTAYEFADLRMREWRPCVVPILVQLHVQQHQLPQAQTWLTHGRTLLDAGNPWPAAHILLDAAEAELSLAQGDAAHALALSLACVTACRRQGWRQQLPLMLLLQGRALHVLDRSDEALQVLQEASDEATATHAQWSLEQISNARGTIDATLLRHTSSFMQACPPMSHS
jgi:DNA-binding SARP family transcriptional activator